MRYVRYLEKTPLNCSKLFSSVFYLALSKMIILFANVDVYWLKLHTVTLEAV